MADGMGKAAVVAEGMATGSPARAEPRTPYSNRHGDKTPDEMPEIARELIMLRGVVSSVEMKVNEVESNLTDLRERISPVMDRREKPQPATVADIKRDPEAQQWEPVSDVATDIRILNKMLSESVENLERLSTRLWSIARDVTL